jgi:hypothetical protein
MARSPQNGFVKAMQAKYGGAGKVAEDFGRNSILIELKPKYVKMIERRTAQMGLFAMEAI